MTPLYNNSRCFHFPDATPAQQARIRELAETIDAHRKRQQAQHPGLTLTILYNVVEQLRAGQPLTAKEQATAPVTAAQVAARFRRIRAAQVQPLLATLAALSQLRHLEPKDAYAA